MAKIRDRIEDFKDAVRREAVSLEYNESKIATIMASFIIHKPRERTAFTKSSLKTLELIGELEQFLVKHRKDYLDMRRTTEQERDSIEQEVLNFVKSCQKQIDILIANIKDEEASSKGWLGVKNADTIAHKHGVVLILSEKLQLVTSDFDQLRAKRFQDTLNRRMPRRKQNPVPNSKATDFLKSRNSEEADYIESSPQIIQQQLEDDETRALQVELTNLLDASEQIESKMLEVSALNNVISSLVLQQFKQIEQLYKEAVVATENYELGNRELSQAIQRNSSSRTFLVLFMIVLSFSILFLDWYN